MFNETQAYMIRTAHLFQPLARELVSVLRGLAPGDWERPTSASQWSVKDVAAHLLDGDLRRLSAQRDGHSPPPPQPITSNADLVAYLNDLNRQWVDAARRLSPRVLVDQLEVSSLATAELFESSDPMGPATFPVGWAGEETSRMWFDIAREYTERWHHQDQIREAVGVTPLAEPRFLRPVLETSLMALPHAYRQVEGPDGTAVMIKASGDAGGTWSLVKGESWTLVEGQADGLACTVRASDLTLSRLLLHRLSPAEIADAVETDGDASLAAPLREARAVMVEAKNSH